MHNINIIYLLIHCSILYSGHAMMKTKTTSNITNKTLTRSKTYNAKKTQKQNRTKIPGTSLRHFMDHTVSHKNVSLYFGP